MKKAIVGKKIGMTQIFTDDGRLVPVTVVEAGPCKVVQKKTTESDGYDAVQVGFDTYAENRAQKLVNKPMAGHFKKADVAPTRYLREFRLDNVAELEVGNELTVAQFEAGEKIDVSGITKGHGYTGTIQRWNQHTGPMAHGSKYHRGVGSLSANSDPSRVFKNKHMAGHYGVERVTIQNLEIVKVDAERNLLLIKGAVPGPKGSIVYIKSTAKTQPVKKGEGANYNSAAAFDGKTVAAQNGTNQQIMVEEQLTGATLELITKIPDGVNMVKNGRVDALAIPKTVYDSVLAENDDLEIAEFAFDFEGGNYIASVKGEQALTDKIQELIDQINEEGLYQQWVDEILLAK